VYEKGNSANGISHKLLFIEHDEQTGYILEGRVISMQDSAKGINIAAQAYLSALDEIRRIGKMQDAADQTVDLDSRLKGY
jgi:hypothetical protein